jgi:peptide/nickel transport system permease protein
VFVSLFAVILVLVLAAPLYASRVANTTPSENHLTDQTVIDGVPTDVVSPEGVPIGPTWNGSYLLGADENGRDLAVRLLYGARTTLVIGFGAVLLTLLLSVPLGLAAGYLGGRTDTLISRLLDLLWSFPALLLGVLLSTAISHSGAQIGPVTIDPGAKLIPVIVIGLVYVPYMTRPLRGQVMSLRGQPFVEAARAAGIRPARLMASELLPHLSSTIVVVSMLLFVNAVVLEAALTFLGAGVNPPEPSVGVLIAAGLNDIVLSPHLLLAPSIALVLIVLSLNGVAEGVRRALDPRGTVNFDLVRGR